MLQFDTLKQTRFKSGTLVQTFQSNINADCRDFSSVINNDIVPCSWKACTSFNDIWSWYDVISLAHWGWDKTTPFCKQIFSNSASVRHLYENSCYSFHWLHGTFPGGPIYTLGKKGCYTPLKTIKPMWIELLCFHLAEIGMIWTHDCSPTKSDTTLGRHSMQGQVGSSSSETTV